MQQKIVELSEPIGGATHCMLLTEEELEFLATLVGHAASEEKHIQRLITSVWRTQYAGLEKFYNYGKPKYAFVGDPALRLYTT